MARASGGANTRARHDADIGVYGPGYHPVSELGILHHIPERRCGRGGPPESRIRGLPAGWDFARGAPAAASEQLVRTRRKRL